MQQKFLVCDPDKCTGCRICDFVCSAIKEKGFNPLLSRIQTVRIEPDLNIAVVCRFCNDAPCIVSCPRKALNADEKRGVIIVDEDVCNGCGWCIETCPFGVLLLHPDDRSVRACDTCEGAPKCVEFCPKGALSFSSMEQFSQRTRRRAIHRRLFGKIPA